MSENHEIEMEFERLKTRVKDVGGIRRLSKEQNNRIEQFCREQHPKCPRCGQRNTKFCYIENKKSARTLQPRYKCNICKVGEDNKEKEFTWGGKEYRERVTEQSNIHQRQDMPSDGGSWQQNTAGAGVTTGVWDQNFLSKSTDDFDFIVEEVDPGFHLLDQINYNSNPTVPNELGVSFSGPEIDDFEIWDNTLQFK